MTTASVPADVWAVYQVLVRYAVAVDQNDFEAVASCFRPDCEIVWHTGTFPDYASFDVWLRATKAGQSQTVHLVQNPLIEVLDDSAVASTYLEAFLHGPDPSIEPAHVLARFDDRLQRDVGGGWRIAHRRSAIMSSTGFTAH